jgi:hypothetical protein
MQKKTRPRRSFWNVSIYSKLLNPRRIVPNLALKFATIDSGFND